LDVLIGRVARELAALEQHMERVYEQSLGGLQLSRHGESWRPAVDVYETDRSVVVKIELAGVETASIRLTVDGEYLQVAGTREPDYPERPKRHLHMEISRGPFERVVRAPLPYDPEAVQARLDAGVLTVDLPKREPSARRVEVRSK
jgi:HSP20 family protein